MRIKPEVNKLLIETKNATKMTKVKLPRKQKKQFIKLYERKMYNSVMIRVQLKNDAKINLKKSMQVSLKALKGFECKAVADVIKKIGIYQKLLSNKIQDNLTIGNCEIKENKFGVLLNFKEC